jgi:hypothetical protein
MVGIWWAIPIGWALADVIGVILIRQYYVNNRRTGEGLA